MMSMKLFPSYTVVSVYVPEVLVALTWIPRLLVDDLQAHKFRQGNVLC